MGLASDEPCPGCGDGDKVPLGHFHCQVCDAEWEDDQDDDDSYPPPCSEPAGHSWVCRDDNEEISYCEHCGADGNA